VDLTALTESAYWQYDPEEGHLYNTEDRVGIGTATPGAKLEVSGTGADNFELLEVNNGPGQQVFSVTGGSVSTHPGTVFRIEGQEQYSVSLLQNSAFETYEVTDSDTYIVVQIENATPTAISMPPATAFPGRKITVRRTGSAPLPITSTVAIDFPDQIDFETDPVFLSGVNRESAVFLSLGAAGWTRIQ
jgi:hypothetical protein